MTLPRHIHVYTYKEGLLSRLAHDLQLSVDRYSISFDSGRVTATLDPRSLRVEGAIHRGALDKQTLSESDERKIAATLQSDVLRCDTYPEIRFEGAVTHQGNGRFVVRGQLSLTGRSAEVELPITLGHEVRGDFEVVPSRWGIEPFRAMAGALKVQDRVRVVFVLPVDTAALNSANWQQAKCTWSSP